MCNYKLCRNENYKTGEVDQSKLYIGQVKVETSCTCNGNLAKTDVFHCFRLVIGYVKEQYII